MEMIIDFPGGAKVDAHFGNFTVKTDQPAIGGGENSAPAPFEIFLSSIGTCAGIYVLGFCRQRNLPTEGIRIVQRMYHDRIHRHDSQNRSGDPDASRFPREVFAFPDPFCRAVRGEETPRKSAEI